MIKNNWQTKKLGEICNLQNGYAFKSSDYVENSKTLIFRMSQIRPGGSLDLNHNSKYLPDNFVEKHKSYLLEDGDVIIAMTDMATETKILGLPTYFKSDGRNFLLNQRVGKLFDFNTNEIEVKYLRYILSSPEIIQYYKSFGKGALQINLGKNDILNAEIPVPPLETQQVIVSKIEQLFSELDQGIADLKTAQAQLKVYRQSVLKHAFEGKLTNENIKEGELPEGWKLVNIEFLLNDIKKGMSTGPFGTMLKKEEHKKKGIPVLGIENIGEGVFQLPNKIFVTEDKAIELKNFKVIENDVIISRSGTVGEICLLPKSMENSLISTNLIRVRLNQSIIFPKYFVYLFQGGKVRNEVINLCKGSSRAFLNQTILKSLAFPFCSLSEQHLIVQEIESRLSVADKMEESIQESLQKAEALRQSILKKAFSGELV